MEFNSTLRNNRASQIGSTISTGGTVLVKTGAPVGVANADSGTTLSTLTAVTYSSASGITTVSATADSSAAASGTPGHATLLTSGGTRVIEGTAGVGTQATATCAVSGGAISGTPTVTAGGSGYSASNPPFVFVSGGGGFGAILTATIVSGAITALTVVNGGTGYTTAPTLTIMPPFDFTFSTTVSLGGTVTLSSGSIYEGNI